MFVRVNKFDEYGGVSVIFALSLVVLLGAAGIGFDFARANLKKTDLQRSLDAGVLAAAQLYASGSSIDAALASAERAAKENAPFYGAGDNVFRFWREGDAIRGEARTALPTTLTQVLGFESMDVGAMSGATATSNGVELVLVLDVSGSMGSKGKIDAARDAAVGLVDKIYGGNETRPDTYVALAPFSGRVNINGHGRGWMTGAAPASAAVKLCTGLRTSTNEENDATPSVEPFPYFTGSTNVCPEYEAIGLSNEKSPIRNAILALEPGHGTSTNKGLAWGWRMISPKWQGLWGSPSLPLSHAKSPGKVVVLMTDGQNHPNQSGDPYTTAQADAQLLRQCAAMKTEGIKIYTVAFDMGTTLTSLYQECASSASHHYDAATGEDLQTIFADIGEYLANGDVRLIH